MEFSDLFSEIGASDITDTPLVKKEPQSEFLDFIVESVPSVMANDNNFQRIKNELVSEEAIPESSCKKRRRNHRPNKSGNKRACRNGEEEDGNNGEPEVTQLPCIVSITSTAVLGRNSHRSRNGTADTSNELQNTSLQSSIPERICESRNPVALHEDVGQNSSNNNFSSKVYEILVDIQSTLKDIKTKVAENSKKIDQLQKVLPLPWSWQNEKSDFNFPVSTEEQLFELEKQLEDNEMATRLVVHLTSRTYTSWKEMVLLCLKYMISQNVAVLYNLNGIKGTKKKFRDLNICNILVECIQYKFKEATTPEIFRRISTALAGARDWQGSRHKKN